MKRGRKSHWVRDPEQQYQLLRWYWQGNYIFQISKTIETSPIIIKDCLSKHTAVESYKRTMPKTKSGKVGRPRKILFCEYPREIKLRTASTPEEIMNRIKIKYGEDIHDLLINFPNEPLLSCSDIAEIMGVSRERVRQIIKLVHGIGAYEKPRSTKNKCKPAYLRFDTVQDCMRKENIKFRRKSHYVYETSKGITFRVSQMGLQNRNIKSDDLYRIANYSNKEVDYFVGWLPESDSVYVIPKVVDSPVIYFHLNEIEEYKGAFHLLK